MAVISCQNLPQYVIINDLAVREIMELMISLRSISVTQALIEFSDLNIQILNCFEIYLM